MNHTLVLADAADVAALRTWLRNGGAVLDVVVRSHGELGCLRVRAADGTEIAVLEDHVGDVAYVTIDGPAAATWATAVGERARCLDVAEILAMLDDGDDGRQWIRALSRLALLRGERAEPPLLQAWSRALAHPHPAVRRAAIRTCHGARWPELHALVVERMGIDVELRGPLAQLAAHLQRIRS